MKEVRITEGTNLNEAKTVKMGAEQPHRGQAFTAFELIERGITEIPTLVSPLLPKVGLAALAGSSDTGKSTMLRQLALDVASSDTFIGFPIEAIHKKSLYVSTEDEENSIACILNQGQEFRKMKKELYKNVRFIFDTHNLLETLDFCLTEEPVDLVVIDAFTDLYHKSMNESNQMRTFLNDYSQLAQKHKCLVMFLHHTGKRTEKEAPSKHHLLGSQAFEAKMRLVLELRRDFIDPIKRHLCVVKGNYLPSEYKTESYVLYFGDNMVFENTGDRVAFELLSKENNSSSGWSDEKIEDAIELYDNLGSFAKVATELECSTSTVHKYLKGHIQTKKK